MFKNALYVLKQSTYTWNKILNGFLLRNGFIKSINDEAFYYKRRDNRTFYIGVYVDDLLCVESNHAELDDFASSVVKVFKTKDLGEVNNFLIVSIKRDVEGIL